MNDLEAAMIWTFGIRLLQTVIFAGPTLLFGLLAAGVMRSLFTAATVRRLFDPRRAIDLLPIFVFVAVTPVCSFGVIPVLHVLRRSGVTPRRLIFYALSAPLFNLWSMLFGLGHLPVGYWLYLLAGSAGVTAITSVWWGWDQRATDDAAAVASEWAIAPTIGRRLALIPMNAGKLLIGAAGRDMAVGLLSVAIGSALFPEDFAANVVSERHFYTMPLLALVMLPAYVSPETAMMQAIELLRLGTVPGGGLLLLVFGSGMNLAVLAFVRRAFGWVRMLKLVAVLGAISLVIAALANPIWSRTAGNDEDDDAFVTVARQVCPTSVLTVFPRAVMGEMGSSDPEALALLALLAVVGVGCGVWASGTRMKPSLHVAMAGTSGTAPALVTQRPWLVWSGASAMIVVIGLHVYFPDPVEAVDQVRAVDTELYSIVFADGPADEATARIAQLRSLTARLEWSFYLRLALSAERRTRIENYRVKLEQLSGRVGVQNNRDLRPLMTSISQNMEACAGS